jgi:hypothetical protein
VLVLALFFVTSGPRLRRIGISFAAAYLLTLAIWPPLWDAFPIGWGKAIQQFSKFPWTGDVRAFGVTYPSTDLPWFYPLLWLPVVITPCGLLALAGGVFGNLRRETSEARSFALLLPIRGGLRNELTLKRWLLFFTVASWAAVLAARPVLYDEDRHLLFLFPPLLIWAGLGFERFRPVIRMGVIAACLIGAALAHHDWGRYSYVYKSSWAGDRSAGRFMGDYWGLCVQNIVRRIPSNVPAGSEVAAGGLWEAAGIQMDRLGMRHSYNLRSSPSGKRPYYRIQINRVGWLEDARRDVERGEAKVLDREIMPLGEDACWLLEYR